MDAGKAQQDATGLIYRASSGKSHGLGTERSDAYDGVCNHEDDIDIDDINDFIICISYT